MNTIVWCHRPNDVSKIPHYYISSSNALTLRCTASGSYTGKCWFLEYRFKYFSIPPDTFMVEDAVEAIGFGTFQWKLSILTGLAWVRAALWKYTVTRCVCMLIHLMCHVLSAVCSDGRCHGDDDPLHLSPSAPLWMEAVQPPGGTSYIGNGSNVCKVLLLAMLWVSW